MLQQELFMQIFSDAHLVDVDLSSWDKQISFYVIADHLQHLPEGRLPLVVIEFIRVHRFDMKFNHVSNDNLIELGPDEHIQWWFDGADVEFIDERWHITLKSESLPSSPRTTIVCEDVNIWQMRNDIPDKLFPGWNKPRAGFIRPGLEVLSGDDNR